MQHRTPDQLKNIMVQPTDTLSEGLPKMDKSGLQVLLVTDANSHLLGIITDGDIRRALLQGLGFNTPLAQIMQPKPKTLAQGASQKEASKIMQQTTIRQIPIIDTQNKVVDLIVWTDCFRIPQVKRKEKVIIMAGGKGTRLDPFTRILPKPMIPLGDKPIIEVIMDKFHQQGFSNFILSLGYKAEIIKMYFAESNGRPYNVDFILEDKPLGTAGALRLLKEKIKETFLVANCDVIVEADYARLLKHHKEEGNTITLVGSLKDFTIPYGVLKTAEQELIGLEEKPSFHYLVNTGIYCLEPEALDYIDKNEALLMTDLLLRVKDHGGKVGVFPYHGQWFDVGQWEDYQNTMRYFAKVE
ncbi:MAG: nucleotidyltransferase family protein [Bacillota bacterium]